MPEEKPNTIEFVLEPLEQTSDLRHVLLTVREYLLQHEVGCTETIHGGKHVRLALFHIDHENDVVVGLSHGKDHVKVYFHHFDPAPELSVLRLQGKGKHSRHVQLTEITDEIWNDIQTLFENTLRNRSNNA